MSLLDAEQQVACDKISDIIRYLPPSLKMPKDQTWIYKQAHHLVNLSRYGGPQPNGALPAGRAVVRKELDKFVKCIKQLEKTYKDFHNPTLGIILKSGYGHGRLESALKTLTDFTLTSEINDVSEIPINVPRSKTRQLEKIVAIDCWYIYYWYTSTAPTLIIDSDNQAKMKLYLKFVSDIFDALKLEGSSEFWARSATEMPQVQKLRRKRSRTDDA